jgi:hypothetical protein
LVLGVGLSTPCWANAPLGGEHYPNGAEDFVSGALPPPGVYLKTYFAQFQKDRLMGDKGKAPVDFKADVSVVVPRFIWVTPMTLGGASVATQLFLPMYWADVESNGLGIDSRDDGLGDILFTPVALGWHFGPNFHLIVAEDLFIPTGNYDREDPASQILSKNQWTFETVVAATYLWNDWDFSAKFMYDFNTKNKDYNLGPAEGELDPGQEFHIDYAIGYSPKPGLRYGISGFSYWQTSKDEVDLDAGGPTIKFDKGVIHALGPTIKYWPNKGRFSATLKYQWQFGAENLPEGQTTWLNMVWVF